MLTLATTRRKFRKLREKSSKVVAGQTEIRNTRVQSAKPACRRLLITGNPGVRMRVQTIARKEFSATTVTNMVTHSANALHETISAV